MFNFCWNIIYTSKLKFKFYSIYIFAQPLIHFLRKKFPCSRWYEWNGIESWCRIQDSCICFGVWCGPHLSTVRLAFIKIRRWRLHPLFVGLLYLLRGQYILILQMSPSYVMNWRRAVMTAGNQNSCLKNREKHSSEQT